MQIIWNVSSERKGGSFTGESGREHMQAQTASPWTGWGPVCTRKGLPGSCRSKQWWYDLSFWGFHMELVGYGRRLPSRAEESNRDICKALENSNNALWLFLYISQYLEDDPFSILSSASPFLFPPHVLTIPLMPCHFCCPGKIKGHWWLPGLQILGLFAALSALILLSVWPCDSHPSSGTLSPLLASGMPPSPGSFLSPWAFFVSHCCCFCNSPPELKPGSLPVVHVLFSSAPFLLMASVTTSMLIVIKSPARVLIPHWVSQTLWSIKITDRIVFLWPVFVSILFLPFSLLSLQILIYNSYLANNWERFTVAPSPVFRPESCILTGIPE